MAEKADLSLAGLQVFIGASVVNVAFEHGAHFKREVDIFDRKFQVFSASKSLKQNSRSFCSANRKVSLMVGEQTRNVRAQLLMKINWFK